MNKTAYVIEFDNGQDYEEHRRWPVSIYLKKSAAQKRVKEMNDWIKSVKAAAPSEPDYTLDQDEFSVMLDNQNCYFSALKYPEGIDSRSDLDGSYHFVELPLT